jgi:hypothetical protein
VESKATRVCLGLERRSTRENECILVGWFGLDGVYLEAEMRVYTLVLQRDPGMK